MGSWVRGRAGGGNSVCSLPPCGGGLGGGVVRVKWRWGHPPTNCGTPTPDPSPKGGGEHTECVAPLLCINTNEQALLRQVVAQQSAIPGDAVAAFEQAQPRPQAYGVVGEHGLAEFALQPFDDAHGGPSAAPPDEGNFRPPG